MRLKPKNLGAEAGKHDGHEEDDESSASLENTFRSLDDDASERSAADGSGSHSSSTFSERLGKAQTAAAISSGSHPSVNPPIVDKPAALKTRSESRSKRFVNGKKSPSPFDAALSRERSSTTSDPADRTKIARSLSQKLHKSSKPSSFDSVGVDRSHRDEGKAENSGKKFTSHVSAPVGVEIKISISPLNLIEGTQEKVKVEETVMSQVKTPSTDRKSISESEDFRLDEQVSKPVEKSLVSHFHSKELKMFGKFSNKGPSAMSLSSLNSESSEDVSEGIKKGIVTSNPGKEKRSYKRDHDKSLRSIASFPLHSSPKESSSQLDHSKTKEAVAEISLSSMPSNLAMYEADTIPSPSESHQVSKDKFSKKDLYLSGQMKPKEIRTKESLKYDTTPSIHGVTLGDRPTPLYKSEKYDLDNSESQHDIVLETRSKTKTASSQPGSRTPSDIASKGTEEAEALNQVDKKKKQESVTLTNGVIYGEPSDHIQKLQNRNATHSSPSIGRATPIDDSVIDSTSSRTSISSASRISRESEPVKLTRAKESSPHESFGAIGDSGKLTKSKSKVSLNVQKTLKEAHPYDFAEKREYHVSFVALANECHPETCNELQDEMVDVNIEEDEIYFTLNEDEQATENTYPLNSYEEIAYSVLEEALLEECHVLSKEILPYVILKEDEGRFMSSKAQEQQVAMDGSSPMDLKTLKDEQPRSSSETPKLDESDKETLHNEIYIEVTEESEKDLRQRNTTASEFNEEITDYSLYIELPPTGKLETKKDTCKETMVDTEDYEKIKRISQIEVKAREEIHVEKRQSVATDYELGLQMDHFKSEKGQLVNPSHQNVGGRDKKGFDEDSKENVILKEIEGENKLTKDRYSKENIFIKKNLDKNDDDEEEKILKLWKSKAYEQMKSETAIVAKDENIFGKVVQKEIIANVEKGNKTTEVREDEQFPDQTADKLQDTKFPSDIKSNMADLFFTLMASLLENNIEIEDLLEQITNYVREKTSRKEVKGSTLPFEANLKIDQMKAKSIDKNLMAIKETKLGNQESISNKNATTWLFSMECLEELKKEILNIKESGSRHTFSKEMPDEVTKSSSLAKKFASLGSALEDSIEIDDLIKHIKEYIIDKGIKNKHDLPIEEREGKYGKLQFEVPKDDEEEKRKKEKMRTERIEKLALLHPSFDDTNEINELVRYIKETIIEKDTQLSEIPQTGKLEKERMNLKETTSAHSKSSERFLRRGLMTSESRIPERLQLTNLENPLFDFKEKIIEIFPFLDPNLGDPAKINDVIELIVDEIVEDGTRFTEKGQEEETHFNLKERIREKLTQLHPNLTDIEEIDEFIKDIKVNLSADGIDTFTLEQCKRESKEKCQTILKERLNEKLHLLQSNEINDIIILIFDSLGDLREISDYQKVESTERIFVDLEKKINAKILSFHPNFTDTYQISKLVSYLKKYIAQEGGKEHFEIKEHPEYLDKISKQKINLSPKEKICEKLASTYSIEINELINSAAEEIKKERKFPEHLQGEDVKRFLMNVREKTHGFVNCLNENLKEENAQYILGYIKKTSTERLCSSLKENLFFLPSNEINELIQGVRDTMEEVVRASEVNVPFGKLKESAGEKNLKEDRMKREEPGDYFKVGAKEDLMEDIIKTCSSLLSSVAESAPFKKFTSKLKEMGKEEELNISNQFKKRIQQTIDMYLKKSSAEALSSSKPSLFDLSQLDVLGKEIEINLEGHQDIQEKREEIDNLAPLGPNVTGSQISKRSETELADKNAAEERVGAGTFSPQILSDMSQINDLIKYLEENIKEGKSFIYDYNEPVCTEKKSVALEPPSSIESIQINEVIKNIKEKDNRIFEQSFKKEAEQEPKHTAKTKGSVSSKTPSLLEMGEEPLKGEFMQVSTTIFHETLESAKTLPAAKKKVESKKEVTTQATKETAPTKDLVTLTPGKEVELSLKGAKQTSKLISHRGSEFVKVPIDLKKSAEFTGKEAKQASKPISPKGSDFAKAPSTKKKGAEPLREAPRTSQPKTPSFEKKPSDIKKEFEALKKGRLQMPETKSSRDSYFTEYSRGKAVEHAKGASRDTKLKKSARETKETKLSVHTSSAKATSDLKRKIAEKDDGISEKPEKKIKSREKSSTGKHIPRRRDSDTKTGDKHFQGTLMGEETFMKEALSVKKASIISYSGSSYPRGQNRRQTFVPSSPLESSSGGSNSRSPRVAKVIGRTKARSPFPLTASAPFPSNAALSKQASTITSGHEALELRPSLASTITSGREALELRPSLEVRHMQVKNATPVLRHPKAVSMKPKQPASKVPVLEGGGMPTRARAKIKFSRTPSKEPLKPPNEQVSSTHTPRPKEGREILKITASRRK